ncbi:hypothetical protein RRG08_055333 [Elysia crispata]|uniref:Uncharacterized protein n=1 Tax=Elysia crispata TaxID=231223 RepID=A0AAE1ARM3_9GAST|nr:hypothetical protein RRG08_055333 [Elysia crispata]
MGKPSSHSVMHERSPVSLISLQASSCIHQLEPYSVSKHSWGYSDTHRVVQITGELLRSLSTGYRWIITLSRLDLISTQVDILSTNQVTVG